MESLPGRMCLCCRGAVALPGDIIFTGISHITPHPPKSPTQSQCCLTQTLQFFNPNLGGCFCGAIWNLAVVFEPNSKFPLSSEACLHNKIDSFHPSTTATMCISLIFCLLFKFVIIMLSPDLPPGHHQHHHIHDHDHDHDPQNPDLGISIILPDLPALPPHLHHEMLGKLLSSHNKKLIKHNHCRQCHHHNHSYRHDDDGDQGG